MIWIYYKKNIFQEWYVFIFVTLFQKRKVSYEVLYLRKIYIFKNGSFFYNITVKITFIMKSEQNVKRTLGIPCIQLMNPYFIHIAKRKMRKLHLSMTSRGITNGTARFRDLHFLIWRSILLFGA